MSYISKVYCILPCTLRRSKLNGGKKTFCVHVCVCVFKISSVFLKIDLMTENLFIYDKCITDKKCVDKKKM